MAPSGKSVEALTSTSAGGREELQIGQLESWLWDAACSIRGAVDAPKFKDYILPLIFLKRLSDVFDDEIDRLAEKFGDRETALELVATDHSLVRFFVERSASWETIRALSTEIGQQLTKIVRSTAEANPSLRGVIDIVDFNATVSGQRIIEDGRLSILIETLSRHRLGLEDVEPDMLGRAYEYLLRKFAEGQGQAAGEFFTPREVGWLIAELLRPEEGMEVYDPTCGSAGLLVKEQLILKRDADSVRRPLQLFGQELNHVTYAVAKMNMIVHDMEGEVEIGDTMRSPKFRQGARLRTFDLVAANPMWNQDGYTQDFYDADGFDRFGLGPPPDGTADWGWVQHVLSSLNDRGRAVIVLDTGAVSRGSGGKGSKRERDIRRELIEEKDWIEGVVLLPENLFYNTAAPGILLCLNKDKPSSRKGRVLLVNAFEEFKKGRPKNFIPDQSVEKIVSSFVEGADVDHFARSIDRDELRENDYNLAPSKYIEPVPETAPLSVEEVLPILEEAQQDYEHAAADLDDLLEGLGLRK